MHSFFTVSEEHTSQDGRTNPENGLDSVISQSTHAKDIAPPIALASFDVQQQTLRFQVIMSSESDGLRFGGLHYRISVLTNMILDFANGRLVHEC